MSIPTDKEQWARWLEHMRRGDFESAWKISDLVLRARAGVSCAHLPLHERFVWSGESLARKRVLVRCYHGLGDTIQFVRYAHLIRALDSEVIIAPQPSLIPLLSYAPNIDRIVSLEHLDATYDCDVEVESMELAHVFRTTIENIPNDVPYLSVPPLSVPNNEKLAVGLVWRSGDWNDRRSVPFQDLLPLAACSRVEFKLLQRDPLKAGWAGEFGTICGGNDPLTDARIIRELDLVITVDTMVAHLTGALGVPVWNLLPYEADWRWMEKTDRSPWYPTMRLFRQQTDGDWRPVIERACKALAKLVAAAG